VPPQGSVAQGEQTLKTIVVGTDGSPSSMKAVHEAATLSAATGADLYIACAVRLAQDVAALAPVGMTLPGGWDEQAHAEAAAAVARAAEVARQAGASAEGRVLTGEAAHALMGLVDDVDADLLVVGSRGMTGAARFLLGSVPNRCAHHANCSVMVVRTD
jgi:nucleotide-binding universal stress UspA family protein